MSTLYRKNHLPLPGIESKLRKMEISNPLNPPEVLPHGKELQDTHWIGDFNAPEPVRTP
jgi:hypothetical protein